MFEQSEFTFGLFESKVDTLVPASAAMEAQKSPVAIV